MPFSMIYGIEAVIPVKISLSSLKVANFAQGHNDEDMVSSLNALEERRDTVFIQLSSYQQRLAQSYNRKVKPQEYEPRDLVLRKVVGSMKDQNARKLMPNWEGPYRVTTTVGAGAYYLEDSEERPLPRPLNVYNLRTYYQ